MLHLNRHWIETNPIISIASKIKPSYWHNSCDHKHTFNLLTLMVQIMKSSPGLYLRILGILFLSILISSCEKNEDDQLIKSQLIGNWKSTNSYYKSYTFFDDNTFIDTAFCLVSENPSEFVVLEVISGDYIIANGQLKFSNIQFKYIKDQYQKVGFSTMYDTKYIVSFDGDILVLNQEDVFESVDNSNSSIIGKWSHDKLIAVYDVDLESKFTGGTVQGLYEFKSDLSVKWQYKSLYGDIVKTGGSTTTYDLSNSCLNINGWGLYNLTVSFVKNKMIWVYGDRTFQRKQ